MHCTSVSTLSVSTRLPETGKAPSAAIMGGVVNCAMASVDLKQDLELVFGHTKRGKKQLYWGEQHIRTQGY